MTDAIVARLIDFSSPRIRRVLGNTCRFACAYYRQVQDAFTHRLSRMARRYLWQHRYLDAYIQACERQVNLSLLLVHHHPGGQ